MALYQVWTWGYYTSEYADGRNPEVVQKIGRNPLECILRFKEANPSYAETKMEYLGRLDPMAEGLLLVRAGAGGREEYLALDKTYEFEVLWGFETDTYDILGLITHLRHGVDVSEEKLESVMNKVSKIKTQSYPPYSSKAVGGKKLFTWAREGRIEEIDRPVRDIKIFSLSHVHTRYISGEEILKEIGEKIALVTGDFRQNEILKLWREALQDRLDKKFLISKFITDVSSGTYIRGLAHEMGKKLGSGALAYSIKRTRVGERRLD